MIKLMLGLVVALTFMSCDPNRLGTTDPKKYDRVMLLYSAGFNNLSSYLKGDIEELKRGALPASNDENVILVYSHFPTGGYNTPSSPTLVRLTGKKDKTVKADTLMIFPDNSISASADQIETVLTYVKENFPSQSYGMIFSSHATGYLPVGFYQDPENDSNMVEWHSGIGRRLTAVPYVEPEYDPSLLCEYQKLLLNILSTSHYIPSAILDKLSQKMNSISLNDFQELLSIKQNL